MMIESTYVHGSLLALLLSGTQQKVLTDEDDSIRAEDEVTPHDLRPSHLFKHGPACGRLQGVTAMSCIVSHKLVRHKSAADALQ